MRSLMRLRSRSTHQYGEPVGLFEELRRFFQGDLFERKIVNTRHGNDQPVFLDGAGEVANSLTVRAVQGVGDSQNGRQF